MLYSQRSSIPAIIGILFVFILFSSALATQYRAVPFLIKGKIIDLETKKPVSGVTLIVFLNDAHLSANEGHSGEYDYPNFAKTNGKGEFEAPTMLYRDSLRIEVKKLEIIAFRSGYTTQRFIIRDPDFSYLADKHLGVIRDIVLKLFVTKKY